MKCLDTTFIIDIVEDPTETRRVASDLESTGEVLATTAFNVYEALLGVHALRDRGHRTKLLDQYARVLSRLVVLPVTVEDAVEAAEIGGEIRRMGHDIGADCLTAATALRAGCDGVVTRNVSHFRRIEERRDLRVAVY